MGGSETDSAETARANLQRRYIEERECLMKIRETMATKIGYLILSIERLKEEAKEGSARIIELDKILLDLRTV